MNKYIYRAVTPLLILWQLFVMVVINLPISHNLHADFDFLHIGSYVRVGDEDQPPSKHSRVVFDYHDLKKLSNRQCLACILLRNNNPQQPAPVLLSPIRNLEYVLSAGAYKAVIITHFEYHSTRAPPLT